MDGKQLLMSYLSRQVCSFRIRENYTQEIMAEKLHIATRSYFDLEHARSGFSTMSLIYFMVLLSDEELNALMKHFKVLLQRSEEDAA